VPITLSCAGAHQHFRAREQVRELEVAGVVLDRHLEVADDAPAAAQRAVHRGEHERPAVVDQQSLEPTVTRTRTTWMCASKKPIDRACGSPSTLAAATARWNSVEPSMWRSVAVTSGLWSSSW
jgi:hypothetical protein